MVVAIIRDKQGRFLERIEGTYRDGVLTYKRNQVEIGIPGVWTLFKFGGTVERLEFNYDNQIDLGPGIGKVAIYEWDGKNCTQMSLNDVDNASVVVDFIKDWKVGEYAEAAVLKRPEDSVKNILIWMFLIVVVVSNVVTIWNTNHAVNQFSKAVQNTPAMNISKQNAQVLAYLVGQLNQTKATQTATNAYLFNLSKYLNGHS